MTLYENPINQCCSCLDLALLTSSDLSKNLEHSINQPIKAILYCCKVKDLPQEEIDTFQVILWTVLELEVDIERDLLSPCHPRRYARVCEMILC